MSYNEQHSEARKLATQSNQDVSLSLCVGVSEQFDQSGGSKAIMAEERVEKVKVVQRHGILGGGFWFASWLFTIGFLHLGFWRGVLALVIWPYYMGAWVRGLVH